MYGSAGAGTNRPVLRLNAVLLRSCVVSWSLRFAEPIVLSDGRKLATLREAITHLAKIRA
jgi:hypothetical protein